MKGVEAGEIANWRREWESGTGEVECGDAATR
jgi:hypothetical protein